MVFMEGMQFHPRGEGLPHFENVSGNRLVVLYRRVRQVVLVIVNCFLYTMVYWMNHFQLLFVTVSTGLTPI